MGIKIHKHRAKTAKISQLKRTSFFSNHEGGIVSKNA